MSQGTKSMMSLLLTSALLVGCSSGLTRDKAKQAIESSEAFHRGPYFLRVLPETTTQAQQAGYLQREVTSPFLYVITPKGRAYFSTTTATTNPPEFQYYFVPVGTPLKRVVSVTGIPEGPAKGPRRVEYEWTLDVGSVPNELHSVYFGAHQTGYAILALYDDGWRVTKLEEPPR